MLVYVAQRVGVALLMVWLVATLVFLLLHLVPGDPAELLLSSGSTAPDPAAVEALRRKLGLNDPILVQYWRYLSGLVEGNLGVSMQDGTPVAEQVALRLPRTLELIAAAAESREPHQVVYYLRDLAQLLHGYYTAHPFLVDDEALRNARLALLAATRTVLASGLGLLGLTAPERM